jgi:hypothetical protein
MTLDHRPDLCGYEKPLTVHGAKILKVRAAKDTTFDFHS